MSLAVMASVWRLGCSQSHFAGFVTGRDTVIGNSPPGAKSCHETLADIRVLLVAPLSAAMAQVAAPDDARVDWLRRRKRAVSTAFWNAGSKEVSIIRLARWTAGRLFSPVRMASVMSHSKGTKPPSCLPTATPFTHTRQRLYTAEKRSFTRC